VLKCTCGTDQEERDLIDETDTITGGVVKAEGQVLGQITITEDGRAEWNDDELPFLNAWIGRRDGRSGRELDPRRGREFVYLLDRYWLHSGYVWIERNPL
jgi:hypothetical protein